MVSAHFMNDVGSRALRWTVSVGGWGRSAITARWSEWASLCVKHLLSVGTREAEMCILSILRLCGDGAGLSSVSPWSCTTRSGGTMCAPQVLVTWCSLGSTDGE